MVRYVVFFSRFFEVYPCLFCLYPDGQVELALGEESKLKILTLEGFPVLGNPLGYD